MKIMVEWVHALYISLGKPMRIIWVIVYHSDPRSALDILAEITVIIKTVSGENHTGGQLFIIIQP